MTKREQRYLYIIYHQSQLINRVISETNAHIARIEADANAEIDRLRLAQVAHDQRKVDVALQSADELWQELQAAEANVVRLRGKLKGKKRMLREE